ncbi:MAG: MATE family efflux transporter [Clostridiales bacterium]|nr:MATE family efflux transporter [Clostridiales bacterium]
MNKRFGKDLTTGNIMKLLISFSAPMLLTNLLQTGYSIINTIWVGQMVGANAVGATAVTFPIVFITIALASGFTMAATILVSQHYGAKDFEMVERIVNTSFSICLIGGISITIILLFLSDPLLKLMGTPAEIFAMSSSYLKISLIAFTPLFMTFLISSVLRGTGDTVTPLLFSVAGLVINAILDPFMIIGIRPFPKMGLDGAAYASLISQTGALILSIIYLNRKKSVVAFNPRKLTIDGPLTLRILKLGLPTMIQQSLVSIGSFVITGIVNSFGAVAVSAFGAAQRIENVVIMPGISLGAAASALTGQNMGAGKPERVKEIFKSGIILTSLVTLVLSGLMVGIPRIMLSMFVNDEAVLKSGTEYLVIIGSAYIPFAIMFLVNGIINGTGRTMITMAMAMISLWAVRLPLSELLSRTGLGTKGIWLGVSISFVFSMLMSVGYYLSGRWKRQSLNHGR